MTTRMPARARMTASLMLAVVLSCNNRPAPQPGASGPVAVVALLQGQVQIRSSEGSVRPATVEAELLLSDILDLDGESYVILDLHNNWLVQVSTSMRVQDIAALSLPPTDRPAAEQLAGLIDLTTISARDDKVNQASRIAGWHVRRNAAQTVTAQPRRDKVLVAEDKDKAVLLEAEPAAESEALAGAGLAKAEASPPETKTEAQVATGRQEQKVAAKVPAKVAVKPAPLAQPQEPGTLPTAALKDRKPASEGARAQDNKAAPKTGSPGPKVESGRTDPPRRAQGGRIGPRPTPGDASRVTFLGADGNIDPGFQKRLLNLLASPKLKACLLDASGARVDVVELVLVVNSGRLESLTLVPGAALGGCKALESWRSANRGPATSTGTLRARVALR